MQIAFPRTDAEKPVIRFSLSLHKVFSKSDAYNYVHVRR